MIFPSLRQLNNKRLVSASTEDRMLLEQSLEYDLSGFEKTL